MYYESFIQFLHPYRYRYIHVYIYTYFTCYEQTNRSIYLAYLSLCLSLCFSLCLSLSLSVYVSTCVTIYPFLSTHLYTYLSMYRSVYLSMCTRRHTQIHLRGRPCEGGPATYFKKSLGLFQWRALVPSGSLEPSSLNPSTLNAEMSGTSGGAFLAVRSRVPPVEGLCHCSRCLTGWQSREIQQILEAYTSNQWGGPSSNEKMPETIRIFYFEVFRHTNIFVHGLEFRGSRPVGSAWSLPLGSSR